MTASAPAARAAARFSSLDAAPMTRHPGLWPRRWRPARRRRRRRVPAPHSPGCTLGPIAQREETRAVALGEGGRTGSIEVHRAVSHQGLGRHDDMAGEATQAGGGHHPLPDGEADDLVAQRADAAGHLAARGEGKWRLDLVLPGDEEAVDEVHAGRLDRHHDAGPVGARDRAAPRCEAATVDRAHDRRRRARAVTLSRPLGSGTVEGS